MNSNTPSPTSPFDHIIIGAGSAGCVVAARLAQAGRRVALIEAGKSDTGNADINELALWKNLVGTEYDYDYTIEHQPRGNSSIRHTRGRMLGGTGSINTCIAFRIPDVDFDRWATEGAIGWDAETMRPFVDKVFNQVNIETANEQSPFHHDLIAAAEAAELPQKQFNQDELTTSIGHIHFSKRGDLRESAATAYLHPLDQWGDCLTVFTETNVHKIIFDDNGQAVAVQTSQGEIRCQISIIIACGAFNTPTLLMRSGVGAAEQLAQHDIPVYINRPGVGEHLLDHPDSMIAWETTQPIKQCDPNALAMAVFYKSNPALNSPDIMCHVGTKVFDGYTRPRGYPTAEHGFSFSPNVMRAQSEGTVRLRSADPEAAPLIDFRYFTHPDDERTLVEGIKLARRIVAQSPLKQWVKRELFPGEAIQTDAALSAYGREVAGTVYHPAGTCKMGAADDPAAVVDPTLRVIGTPNLYIADASIFPSMIGVNPNIACMAIGERCANFILQSS